MVFVCKVCEKLLQIKHRITEGYTNSKFYYDLTYVECSKHAVSQAKIKVHACGCYGGPPLFLKKTGIVRYKSHLRQCKKF